MSEREATRRGVLKGIGASVAAAMGTAALSGSAAASSPWESVESPTGNTLYDVEYTDAGAYAVAGGGIVLERTELGWQKILDGGPTGNGNSLYGADVTDDGERLWFVGSSGAIGEYDVESGVLTDHSAPMDVTNNFNDVSVTGQAGEANVYVAGDSGKMYYSFENGASETWEYVTPGSGSAINAVDFFEDRKGHIVDGNKSVFRTQDGSTWNKIGLADANVNFYGVDSDGFDDVWVSGGGGMLFHWDGVEWTPHDTGDAGLRDIEVTDGDGDGYTVGGGGKVYELDSEWTQNQTPTGQNLKAVVRGSVDIAVGAGGTIIER
ncbi:MULTISPECIES: WD40/YVTN/BNR-like repeat-containing protein [Haloarcula]|uniref:Twin-arginine translocation signal domain-containing protein n=1 Tax=Haloarcula pellucida TaxID=1427151 RepID=A0A830GL96_9EURY|nr:MULTISPECIES: hypothetical protein [Halomicroarcula]MBX0348537.1 hypothetical protein [Halomicroarcula pellucida]MDS0278362.1 hypothetical protein [Halomicroarcula sp. S1AR25-4]GGN92913.1 hypothetical protein GCM10009030_17700 [Halomicroarcula pellucida]